MKRTLLLTFFLLPAIILSAQSIGPNWGTGFSTLELAGGNATWSNIENASGSDDAFAAFDDLEDVVGSHTDYLIVSGFKFSIPAEARILGIEAFIESSDETESTADHSIRLVKDGIPVGSDYSTGALYFSLNFRDQYNKYGGPTDLWGKDWRPDEINDQGFGIAIAAKRIVTGTPTKGAIDDVRLTVYYTTNFATLPLRLVSFSASPKKDRTTLTWRTMEESAMERFEVERSANGTDFAAIGTVPCLNRLMASEYSFDDRSPVNGTEWYRLKIISINGAITYSRIITVYNTVQASFYLYPSPWHKGSSLFIRNTRNERLTVVFYSTTGELVGRVTTSTHTVPMEKLQALTGCIHYKIFSEDEQVLGSGKISVF